VDLPKQAKEQMSKLDGPGGAAKVRILFVCNERLELTRRKAEELAKTLGQMKFVLQGTQGALYLW
jgi:calcium binding protein 39